MIIGIAGKLGSGKSAVANFLKEDHNFVEMAFADHLKKMCMRVFGLSEHQCYDQTGKLLPLKNRMVLSGIHLEDILDYALNEMRWPQDKVNKEYMVSLVGKHEFVNAREILQIVGTEVCRGSFDPAFHAKVLFTEIESGGKHVCISDARFFNERKMISVRGGKNLLVDCVQLKEQTSNHQSEKEFGGHEDYDCVILNDMDKGLEHLRSQVKDSIHIFEKAKELCLDSNAHILE